MDHLRIVLYSHDSLGLGHVRRNLALAHALSNQLPYLTGRDVTGILISGTALAPGFDVPAGWDWLILPGVEKSSAGYQPRNLTVPMQDLVSLRAGLLESVLGGFLPDLVVVDRHATGIHHELETALRRVRAAGPVRTVLGLREILDAPEAAIAEWEREGGAPLVNDLFDAIWVYGDPAVHDPVASGEIPPAMQKLVRYTGYLAAGRPAGPGHPTMPAPYFLTTVGGGADGHALAALASAAELPPGVGHLVVAGPQMPADQLADLRRSAVPGARIVGRLEDMVLHLRAARAIVSMGGYNTVCEIMSTHVPALIVPRTQSRSEQRIRAASLASAGYLEYHEIGTLTPAILSGWLATRLGTRVDRRKARLDGLVRVPQLAAELLQPLVPAASTATGSEREGAAHAAV
ncbi:glycosyltransferase family protein [Arthrobacter sp. NPDC056727]|uniref:glycosyltransferase family protein n=1 Tax=Arthrobacter sp. NPDC056727 TaxID=3345927 RepID=UPI0036727B21